MKIAILSQPSNFHCQKWARALQKQGNEVLICSLENHSLPDVETVCLQKNKPTWTYSDFWFSGQKLREVLKQEQVDIVHPLHLTPYGTWARWAGVRPCIAAAMGADVFEYLPYNAIPALFYRNWSEQMPQKNSLFKKINKAVKKKYFTYQVQKVLQFSDFITADNQALIDALVNYFHVPENKLRLQRWGIEEELFQNIDPQAQCLFFQEHQLSLEKPIVLSPRGLMPIYQGDIILQALEKLLSLKVSKEWQFVVLSAGYPIPNPLLKYIHTLESKYSHLRVIKKQISREQTVYLWKQTKAFISAPIYDGYSAAVAEGRYVGAIPILNNIPANREVVRNGENGIIIDNFKPETLFQTLHEVLQNFSAYYEKFGVINKTWMQSHGLLWQDARSFTEWLRSILY